MIKNDHQKKITIENLENFKQKLKSKDFNKVSIPLSHRIMRDAIQSQIDTFEEELREYDALKNNCIHTLTFKFHDLPKSLIKARIASGIPIKELSAKTNIKVSLLKKYEENDYESAPFVSILLIIQALQVESSDIKMILCQNKIELEKYSSAEVKLITDKIRKRRTLLPQILQK